MLSGLIGKLHEIYAVDKFKVYLCTIPTPSPLARPPAPSQGDLTTCTFTAYANGSLFIIRNRPEIQKAEASYETSAF